MGRQRQRAGLLTAVRRVLDETRSQDVTCTHDAFGNRLSITEYGAYGTTNGALAADDPRVTTATVASE